MSCGDYWPELLIAIKKSLQISHTCRESSDNIDDIQDEVRCAAELHLSWFKRAGPRQVLVNTSHFEMLSFLVLLFNLKSCTLPRLICFYFFYLQIKRLQNLSRMFFLCCVNSVKLVNSHVHPTRVISLLVQSHSHLTYGSCFNYYPFYLPKSLRYKFISFCVSLLFIYTYLSQ